MRADRNALSASKQRKAGSFVERGPTIAGRPIFVIKHVFDEQFDAQSIFLDSGTGIGQPIAIAIRYIGFVRKCFSKIDQVAVDEPIPVLGQFSRIARVDRARPFREARVLVALHLREAGIEGEEVEQVVFVLRTGVGQVTVYIPMFSDRCVAFEFQAPELGCSRHVDVT